MYTKKEFTEKLKVALQKRFPETEIKQMTVDKNHQQLEGLMIQQKGAMAAPIFYPEGWYEDYCQGKDYARTEADFLLSVQNYLKPSVNLDPKDLLKNWREQVTYFLVSADQEDGYLKGKAYTVVLDMAKVYAIELPEFLPGASGRAPIPAETLEKLGVSLEELDSIATKNTMRLHSVTYKWMQDVLMEEICKQNPDMSDRERREIQQSLFPDGIVPLLVITNQARMDGAATMLYDGALDTACDLLQTDDIYILPSSRHEVLALPGQESCSVSDLLDMVRHINASEVKDEDLLTTQVYRYTRGQELVIADVGGLHQEASEIEMGM